MKMGLAVNSLHQLLTGFAIHRFVTESRSCHSQSTSQFVRVPNLKNRDNRISRKQNRRRSHKMRVRKRSWLPGSSLLNDAVKIFDDLPGLFRSLGILKQVQVAIVDDPLVGQKLKINDPIPVFFAVENDGNLLHSASLA